MLPEENTNEKSKTINRTKRLFLSEEDKPLEILPSPSEINESIGDKNIELLKDVGNVAMSYAPLVGSFVGGAVSGPVGWGIGAGALGLQMFNDIQNGESMPTILAKMIPLGKIFGGTTLAKKVISEAMNYLFAGKNAEKFINKGVEIVEKQQKGVEVSKAELSQFDKMSKRVKVDEKAQEQIMQYMAKNKDAYNTEIANTSLDEATKLELTSNFDKFLSEQGENLTSSKQFERPIQAIKNYLSEQNLSDIDLLNHFFDKPELFPSIQSEALPPPLKTPLERAIYETINPKLQNPESKIGMNVLYPRQSSGKNILEQLKNYQQKQPPTGELENFLLKMLKRK